MKISGWYRCGLMAVALCLGGLAGAGLAQSEDQSGGQAGGLQSGTLRGKVALAGNNEPVHNVKVTIIQLKRTATTVFLDPAAAPAHRRKRSWCWCRRSGDGRWSGLPG